MCLMVWLGSATPLAGVAPPEAPDAAPGAELPNKRLVLVGSK